VFEQVVNNKNKAGSWLAIHLKKLIDPSGLFMEMLPI